MQTIIEEINPKNIDINKIKKAAQVLKNGGLVAFPTETVYGLGADALNIVAAKKIYSAKGRPSDNPLIVHIADESTLDLLAVSINASSRKLIKKFWPGPLTLILKKSDNVPYETTGGLDTVAVRMPDNPIALALIKESKLCIAAPSANSSGKPSPSQSKHVVDDLYGKIDMVIEGGDVAIGIESTILDMTSNPPLILRPGYVTREMIEEVIGPVELDKPKSEVKEDFIPKAPGMKYRHYAPNAEMILVEGNLESVVDKINTLAKKKETQGIKVGVIATDESADLYKYGTIISIGSRSSEKSIAYNLYNILRKFNETEVGVIYCESFSKKNLGQAIMNRLIKASSNHIIQLDGDSNIKE